MEYLDRLAKLHNLIAECDSSCITIIGDFNANVKTRANFAVLLENFVSNLATCGPVVNDSLVIHIPMLVMLEVASHVETIAFLLKMVTT